MSEKTTRPYVAKVFGVTFIVDCANPGQVETHLVARLRQEIQTSKATFEDGFHAARLGIETEFYGDEKTADMFSDEADYVIDVYGRRLERIKNNQPLSDTPDALAADGKG